MGIFELDRNLIKICHNQNCFGLNNGFLGTRVETEKGREKTCNFEAL